MSHNLQLSLDSWLSFYGEFSSPASANEYSHNKRRRSKEKGYSRGKLLFWLFKFSISLYITPILGELGIPSCSLLLKKMLLKRYGVL
jgi:hypothetical protein